MKLLLDLGNSRCKYATVENGKVEYSTQNYGPFGKLYTVKSLCDQLDQIEQIVICSVLSQEINAQIKTTLAKDGNKNVLFLTSKKDSYGVKLIYDDLSKIGVDRVAAMIGAKDKYSGSSCVVDCGTAVTIDKLDSKGIHQGGVILPGLKSMQKVLLSDTKIKSDDIEVDFAVLSRSTEGAIYSGCISAVIGGIEYVVNKMTEDYDSFDQIILTGGDAELIGSYLSMQVKIDATLVLDGLKVVLRHV